MKIALLVWLSLLLLTMNAFSQHNEKAGQLKEIISAANIPGIQLIYSKDNHKDAYSLGTIAIDSKLEVTSKTIFEAASLSKWRIRGARSLFSS